MRRLRTTTLIGCISSAFALSLGACGKDKSEPAAVAEGEAPLEGAATDKGESKPDEDASKPSAEADATAERPRRPGRDKNGHRRPPPVRHAGTDVAGGHEPGEPGSGPGSQPGEPQGPGEEQVGKTPSDAPGQAPGGLDGPMPTGNPLTTPTGNPLSTPTGNPLSTPTGNPPTIVSGGVPGIPVPEPTPATPPAPPVEPEPVAGNPGQASRDAETLLPQSVIQEQLGAVRLSALGALPGIAIRPGYSSILYGRADGTKFGLSLQVWQDPSRNDSEERYRRMRLQYPNGEEVNVMAPAKAFFSRFGGVRSMTFVDSVTRTVVSVSCGEGVCTHEQLTKLAKAVRARF